MGWVDISAELLMQILGGFRASGGPRMFVVDDDPIPDDAMFHKAELLGSDVVRVWFFRGNGQCTPKLRVVHDGDDQPNGV